MKAFLLYKDRDFILSPKFVVPSESDRWRSRSDVPREVPPPHEQALIRDLELHTLCEAMAPGDNFLFEVAKNALMSPLTNPDEIVYRQAILRDCLANAPVIHAMYGIAMEALEAERKNYRSTLDWPGIILHRSVEILQLFVGLLKRLRQVADDHAGAFKSDGFTTLLATLKKELRDEYFANIQAHLKRLKFRDGVLLSARLGKGNKGTGYVLRRRRGAETLWDRLFGRPPPAYTYHLAPRDEAGAKAFSELRDTGLNLVANAAAQSVDHILSFLTMLRRELAFYIGCMNLRARLAEIGEPTCFPVPRPLGERGFACRELYDVCLALSMMQKVIGNNVDADAKDLVVITGANKGGKSVFLRSVGLAQLMMQSGLFVAAEAFTADICARLFTHYKREEDVTMKSGKFDEELKRMNELVNNLAPRAMILFNESFAATNEREGSEIGRQIVTALLEKGIKVFFVTHLYEFASGFYNHNREKAFFLRAERESEGQRTFKLVAGEPLRTSFSEDLYYEIFAEPRTETRTSGSRVREIELAGTSLDPETRA